MGAIATGLAGLAAGAALGAGYRFAKKLGDEPAAPPPPGPGGEAVNPGRRRALRVLAGTGAAAATVAAAPAHAARAPKAVPPEAMGMLYDTTRCIGCKACVVACREANDLAPDLSPTASTRPPRPERPDEERHQALQGGRQGLLHEVAVHALRGSRLRERLHAALALEGREDRDRQLQPRVLRGLPLLPDGLPVQRREVRVRQGGAEDRQVRAVPPPRRRREARRRRRLQPLHAGPRARLLRGLPARGGHLRQADELLAEAKRRLAANPGAYVPRVYGETEAGGTQVLYLSHVPFEKLGLPDYGPQGVPHTAYTIQEGLYRGFAAPVALYVALGAVLWRNRKSRHGEEAKP